MKQIYAFENKDDYEKYQDIIKRFTEKLNEYQLVLENEFALLDPPRAIVWTTKELATTIFSDVPIPAFTNKDIIYISPDLSSWKKLFIEQLEGHSNPKIEEFYENMSENHLFTIVGHELTHHSDLFMDEFDDEREDSIWFEEGMCDYLSRKIILDNKEFNEITNVELELVDIFKSKYGSHSLDKFGSSTYQGSLTSIMFDYWRSYLAIKFLVEQRYNNDIHQVFTDYHNWDKEGRRKPLTEHFQVTTLFN
ncbi:hypothetical protein ACFO4N_17450 [Camelliibacillus cellulosilyticus]|uniref:Elongation factor Tu n=1 Tax=Camelliibacillus cellulosilyticus TaxID=2174486 RepID=A0ABV9GSG3_9BACL